jgi:hypothetical protein
VTLRSHFEEDLLPQAALVVHAKTVELDQYVTVTVEAVLEGLRIERTPIGDQVGKPAPRYASLPDRCGCLGQVR